MVQNMVKPEALEKIVADYQLKLLVLLGSYGTDDYRPGESDIDLAYLSDNIFDGDIHLQLLNDLAKLFAYSKIDLIDLQRAGGLLKFQVANTGRVLYQETEDYFANYSLYCLRYYYDTAKFRRLKQEFFEEQLEVLKNG